MAGLNGATHAYVGTTACGCVVAGCVDVPGRERDTARTVAEYVRDGCTVERVPIGDARTRLQECHHEPSNAQAALAL
jgi:hypothetical protein